MQQKNLKIPISKPRNLTVPAMMKRKAGKHVNKKKNFLQNDKKRPQNFEVFIFLQHV